MDRTKVDIPNSKINNTKNRNTRIIAKSLNAEQRQKLLNGGLTAFLHFMGAAAPLLLFNFLSRDEVRAASNKSNHLRGSTPFSPSSQPIMPENSNNYSTKDFSEEGILFLDTNEAGIQPQLSALGEGKAIVMHTDLPVPESVTDNMSFGEAFAAARHELGKGGIFEWQGNSYNTYYKEEWEALGMSEKNTYCDALNQHTHEVSEAYIHENDFIIHLDDMHNDAVFFLDDAPHESQKRFNLDAHEEDHEENQNEEEIEIDLDEIDAVTGNESPLEINEALPDNINTHGYDMGADFDMEQLGNNIDLDLNINDVFNTNGIV